MSQDCESFYSCLRARTFGVGRHSMGTRVYIGNLPADVVESELEDIFKRYGKYVSCDLKGGREGAPRFAFVEFDDPRDAAEAVRGENGQEFAGGRLRVRACWMLYARASARQCAC